MSTTPTIFLSYSWANADVAGDIDTDFQLTGITMRRDIRDIAYRESIKEFMQSITTHNYVLVLISNEFIRSANCMYEVMELLQDRAYKEKILPIILDETKIFHPSDRIEIIKYWNDRKFETEELLKTIDATQVGSVLEDLKHYKNICENLDNFISYIKEINCRSLKDLKNEKYKSIFDLIGYNIDGIKVKKITDAEKDQIMTELIARNKDLEQFAYIVSHNLRVPVANIMGFSDAIKFDNLSDVDKQEFIDGMVESAKRLDEVVRDLNVLLQVQRRFNEEKEIVKFSLLIDEILLSLANAVKAAAVKIEVDFIDVDEILTLKSYLYSIFLNLITNAIKYRRNDVVPHVTISSKKLTNKIIITIKDNGLGIDLNKRGGQVFGLYKRFHHHIEGKGVGLYMVKKQVETLGGKISLTSKVNEGTEFYIEMPAPE